MYASTPTASPPAAYDSRGATGTTLGPWRLDRLLGAGAWTEVYLAAPLDAACARAANYAVKLLRAPAAVETHAIAMLQREAFVSRAVAHPHLTCVLSAHVDRAPWFLVLPYQPGRTLQQWLIDAGQLPVATALWVIRQVAEGLNALHQHGWIHGDVKPDNVFVAHNGHVTVGDLGFARQLHEVQSQPGYVLGTPAYLAPECGNEFLRESPATDSYALGVVLYQLLTGRLPFPQTDEAELAAAHRIVTPPDPRRLAPQIPANACRLIRRLLAKDPLRRPTGLELVQWLVDLEIDAFSERLPDAA